MRKHDAITLTKNLHRLLMEQGVPVQHMFLFGSAAREIMHRWSDIDIAVVADAFRENPLKEYCIIASLAYGINPRISILYFRPEHFEASVSSVVREILSKGIPVHKTDTTPTR